jgi:hypothetical protein
MKLKSIMATVVAAVVAPASAFAAPVLWSGNGHYYEYVSGNINWANALAAAALATPLAGGTFTPYLVTITSAEENAFLTTLGAPDYFWTAGSDADVEGVWKWVAGPETGAIFFGPGAAPGAYTNWRSGEPNNIFGAENSLVVNGGWNDGTGTSQYVGYIVEYSAAAAAVPEPASWAMLIAGFGLIGALQRRRNLRVA